MLTKEQLQEKQTQLQQLTTYLTQQAQSLTTDLKKRISENDIQKILKYLHTYNLESNKHLFQHSHANIFNIMLSKKDTFLPRSLVLQLDFTSIDNPITIKIWLKSKHYYKEENALLKESGAYKSFSRVLTLNNNIFSTNMHGLLTTNKKATINLDVEFIVQNKLCSCVFFTKEKKPYFNLHICPPVYKIGTSKSNKTVYDSVYGIPLDVYLATYTISNTEAFKFARDIIQRIAALHALNLSHRDLKPDNILVINGTAYLNDFSSISTNNTFQPQFYTKKYYPAKLDNFNAHVAPMMDADIKFLSDIYIVNHKQDTYALILTLNYIKIYLEKNEKNSAFSELVDHLVKKYLPVIYTQSNNTFNEIYNMFFLQQPNIYTYYDQDLYLKIHCLQQTYFTGRLERNYVRAKLKANMIISRLYSQIINPSVIIADIYYNFMSSSLMEFNFATIILFNLEKIHQICIDTNNKETFIFLSEIFKYIEMLFKIHNIYFTPNNIECQKQLQSLQKLLQESLITNLHPDNRTFIERLDHNFISDLGCLKDNDLTKKISLTKEYAHNQLQSNEQYYTEISKYKTMKHDPEIRKKIQTHIDTLDKAIAILDTEIPTCKYTLITPSFNKQMMLAMKDNLLSCLQPHHKNNHRSVSSLRI